MEERERRAVVRVVDAEARGEADVVDVVVRISQSNASTSSTTMLWILRFMLWCFASSKR